MNREEQITYMERLIEIIKERINYWRHMSKDKDLSKLMISQLEVELKAYELYLKKLRKGEVK